jgi:O-antigen/teichoic acid export membrane protein
MSGNLASNFISLVAITLVAHFSNPHDMGMWNIALLVILYSPILQLGVINGLNRDLPYLIGIGDNEKALKIAGVAYSWCLILSAMSVAGAILIAIWYIYIGDTLSGLTTIALGVIVSCSWPTLYLTATYRTNSEFGRLARNGILVSVAGFVLTIFVYLLGYVGILMRASLLALLGVAVLFYKRPIPVPPKWNKTLFGKLSCTGLPILMLGQLDTIFMTMDRLVLSDSLENLGYFTIAIQVKTFVGIIPAAFGMVIYPQMAHKYGETHDAMNLWRIARKGAINCSILGLVIGIIGWLTIPLFVDSLLPKYSPGINAAQWAAFIGLAMGLSVFNNIFNIIGRQEIFLICLALGVCTFVGAWYFLTKRLGHPELASAVQSMLIATLLMSVLSAITSKYICVLHDKKNGHI